MQRSNLAVIFAIFTVLSIAACGDDDSGRTGNPDAAATTIDAPVTQIDARPIDAPAGATCTGAAYDPCTDNTQCMSNNCRLFNGAGLQVCTQACDGSNPCPTQNGQPVPCNNMGICRPVAANTCTPP